MFLLVPAHPGFPGQIPQSRKTVVCVCVFCSAQVGECFFWYRLAQVVPEKIHTAVKWLCVYFVRLFCDWFQLVSVGCDGRILVWQLQQHQKVLRLTDGYLPSYLFKFIFNFVVVK